MVLWLDQWGPTEAEVLGGRKGDVGQDVASEGADTRGVVAELGHISRKGGTQGVGHGDDGVHKERRVNEGGGAT